MLGEHTCFVTIGSAGTEEDTLESTETEGGTLRSTEMLIVVVLVLDFACDGLLSME